MGDRVIFATAQELADGIRERRYSAVEVVQAHLDQIRRHNPTVNAVVTVDEAGALRRAQEADVALARGEIWGPLHGVPITVKDLIATKGMRTTHGVPERAHATPDFDAEVVGRLREAGAIILGKTNVPPNGSDVQTNNLIFGRTNNPWDLQRTPGGSTGGGAAALACGMSPLEIGSDLGGSVRQPAHYCGVYALKPTSHRVPVGSRPPAPPPTPRPCELGAIGPLAHSVGDLRLALAVIAEPFEHDAFAPPVPLEPVLARPINRLRIAWCSEFSGAPVGQDTKRVLTDLAAQLEATGAIVEERIPAGFDCITAMELWGAIHAAEYGGAMTPERETAAMETFCAFWGRDEPFCRGVTDNLHATMRQYLTALRRRQEVIASLEQFFSAWDALLCPVSATSAFSHCPSGSPITIDGYQLSYAAATASHCLPFNLTGHPVVVIPAGKSREGLPIGVQVVGRRWDELGLLTVAEHLGEIAGPFLPPSNF